MISATRASGKAFGLVKSSLNKEALNNGFLIALSESKFFGTATIQL
jgi:hypothetical protein